MSKPTKKKKKQPALVKSALVVDDTPEENTPGENTRQTPDQYIAAVLTGDVVLDGMEGKVANNLRGQKDQQFKLASEIQRLVDDLRRAQDLSQQLGGRIDENTRLLLDAEGERRGTTVTKG